MYIADGWKDYEVIDTGDGEKLERRKRTRTTTGWTSMRTD